MVRGNAYLQVDGDNHRRVRSTGSVSPTPTPTTITARIAILAA